MTISAAWEFLTAPTGNDAIGRGEPVTARDASDAGEGEFWPRGASPHEDPLLVAVDPEGRRAGGEVSDAPPVLAHDDSDAVDHPVAHVEGRFLRFLGP
ncbi:MAG TPA: hypothetical protein VHH52_09925 [Pseudonocardiaceae bacterium]|nr:hypothetical protein [Pseudonocardiaceae bacterium]